MYQPTKQVPEFSLGEARRIVGDLFEPNPVIYWTDFLLSLTIGSFCYEIVVQGDLIVWIVESTGWHTIAIGWPLTALFFCVACLGLYRAASFTHELVHLRDGTFKTFRMTWNLLCGIPFLMPSFTYHTHVHHHRRGHYATREDGEYIQFANGPPRNILLYLSQSFVIPLLAIARFLILAPLTWISPFLWDKIYQHASTMLCDPTYVRPLPTQRQRRLWRLQETACFLLTATFTVLIFAGFVPIWWLAKIYLTAVCIVMLNAVRTIGAHRYRCTVDQEITFVEQLLDTVNYPRRPLLTELWAPLGLRFHALHHVFPSLPYHSLPEAHARLIRELPADSPCRRTISPSLWTSIAQLWREASESDRESPREMDAKAA